MLLMIDNYDSFTFNLVQYFGELGQQVKVLRNDEVSVAEISPYVFRVTGCEHEATYYCSAADGSPQCNVDQAR